MGPSSGEHVTVSGVSPDTHAPDTPPLVTSEWGRVAYPMAADHQGQGRTCPPPRGWVWDHRVNLKRRELPTSAGCRLLSLFLLLRKVQASYSICAFWDLKAPGPRGFSGVSCPIHSSPCTCQAPTRKQTSEVPSAQVGVGCPFAGLLQINRLRGRKALETPLFYGSADLEPKVCVAVALFLPGLAASHQPPCLLLAAVHAGCPHTPWLVDSSL